MRLFAFIVFAAAALSSFGQSAPAANGGAMGDAKVYVHSMRNGPAFKKSGSAVEVKNGSMLDAANLTVECGPGQYAMLIFSNRGTVMVAENSSLTIDVVEHAPILKTQMKWDDEPASSATKMRLNYGDVYFVSPIPRPTSTFMLETDFGSIDAQNRKFCVSQNKEGLKIALADGRMTFKTPDGMSEFIKSNQTAIVKKDGEKYSLKLEGLPRLTLEKMNEEFSKCALVMKSVDFYIDEAGNMRARRVIPKSVATVSAKGEMSK